MMKEVCCICSTYCSENTPAVFFGFGEVGALCKEHAEFHCEMLQHQVAYFRSGEWREEDEEGD